MEGLLTVHYSQQYASYRKKINLIVDISHVWQLQSSLITFTMGTRSELHGTNIAHCVVLLTDEETAGLEMAREILVMQAISADNDHQMKQYKNNLNRKNMAHSDDTNTFKGK